MTSRGKSNTTPGGKDRALTLWRKRAVGGGAQNEYNRAKPAGPRARIGAHRMATRAKKRVAEGGRLSR